MNVNYVAIDNYGETYHNLGKFPRKELMTRLASSHCEKMYTDNTKTGEARHSGYVIAGLWITLFEVKPINT